MLGFDDDYTKFTISHFIVSFILIFVLVIMIVLCGSTIAEGKIILGHFNLIIFHNH